MAQMSPRRRVLLRGSFSRAGTTGCEDGHFRGRGARTHRSDGRRQSQQRVRRISLRALTVAGRPVGEVFGAFDPSDDRPSSSKMSCPSRVPRGGRIGGWMLFAMLGSAENIPRIQRVTSGWVVATGATEAEIDAALVEHKARRTGQQRFALSGVLLTHSGVSSGQHRQQFRSSSRNRPAYLHRGITHPIAYGPDVPVRHRCRLVAQRVPMHMCPHSNRGDSRRSPRNDQRPGVPTFLLLTRAFFHSANM